MTSWIVDNIWTIPALPLVVSLVILSLPNSRRTTAGLLAVAGQVLSLTLAIFAFLATMQSPGFRAAENFTWFTFGETALRIGWVLDPLAATMLVMITLVGLCIFIFSNGYMADDKNFVRFFAYLSFFSSAMLGLVIANSLLLFFVCWELVGLASYLLIGFWIHKPSAAAAARKAFITTRIGDLGFFLGILWLYARSGTLLFYDHGNGCLESAGLVMLGGGATFIALLIFCGAIGKSGQFPLHVWLPDAMEGPTPVSALIHAATMVAAGVFLVARVYPVFSFSAINGVTTSLTIVVWTGVVTALMAALIAVAQSDIKRILAYSTVSQLGLMMVSLGVGGVAAGMMHLLAHGFFKALLFLGAGSVIHGLHHEQDIRKMGGLRQRMPITFRAYAIGTMSLVGVPFFFSGAWTKEEILHETAHWPASRLPHYLMFVGVILTALYMTRQIIYVFFGNVRGASHEARESPRVMTVPLIVLVFCTIFLGVALTPAWPWLYSYLIGETPRFEITQLVQPALFVSAALVAAGIGLALFLYRRVAVQDRRVISRDPLEESLPAVFRFLENKMWIDELYERTVIALSKWAAWLVDWMDRNIWDGIVRGFGVVGQLFARITSVFDERGINDGVDDTTGSARGLGRLISVAHSGQVQTYLGVIAIGMLALLLLFAWLA